MTLSGSRLPCRLKQLLPDFFVRIEGELTPRAEELFFQSEPFSSQSRQCPELEGDRSGKNCVCIRLVSETSTDDASTDGVNAVPPWKLLAPSEPWLGLRRIETLDPLVLELKVPDPQHLERALDTAFRLSVLLHVWKRGGLLLHATGLFLSETPPVPSTIDSRHSAKQSEAGLVGLAVSGGGKSTLTNLAQGFHSLSDETVALIPTKAGTWQIYGTMFRSSSAKIPQTHRVIPLNALLILKKSPTAHLERASHLTLAHMLLDQTYVDEGGLGQGCVQQAFRRAATLARAIPAYEFFFPKVSAAATDLLHEAILRAKTDAVTVGGEKKSASVPSKHRWDPEPAHE